jgi:hypothetical protein
MGERGPEASPESLGGGEQSHVDPNTPESHQQLHDVQGSDSSSQQSQSSQSGGEGQEGS